MSALERVTSPNGVVWLRSPRLAEAGFTHGFSTRHGGVSVGAFASLNLAGRHSTGGEDRPEFLDENRRRFLEAIDPGGQVATAPVATVRQVHGATVAEAGECVSGMAQGDGSRGGADAIVDGPRCAAVCMIRVADCVPVLIADGAANTVCAVHAGWRGILAGVVGAAVNAVRARSIERAPRLVAAIGPCAGVDAFEVGDEVTTEFARCNLIDVVHRRATWVRPHVDLFTAVQRMLIESGIEPESIDGVATCTMSGAQDYFSHRRDGGVTGRMAAAISARTSAPK